MNEIRELFDMLTKQKEPHQDAWKEQEDRQRRTERNRRIAAFVGVAAVVVAALLAVAFTVFLQAGGGPAATPADQPPSVNQSTTPATPSPSTADEIISSVAADGYSPRLSPDGTMIAFLQDPQRWPINRHTIKKGSPYVLSFGS